MGSNSPSVLSFWLQQPDIFWEVVSVKMALAVAQVHSHS